MDARRCRCRVAFAVVLVGGLTPTLGGASPSTLGSAASNILVRSLRDFSDQFVVRPTTLLLPVLGTIVRGVVPCEYVV